MADIKPHYTISEAAKLIGVSRPLIYKAIEDGSLRAWKTWSRGTLRIHQAELDAWTQRTTHTKSESTTAA